MRIVSSLALAAALAGATLATPAFAKKEAAAAPAKYSPAVQKGFNDAVKQLNAGDVAGATTAYQTMKASAQTDDDKSALGSLAIQIGQKTQNNALTMEGIDMVLASGKATPEQQKEFPAVEGKLAYQAKDYRKAATALMAAQKAGNTDPTLVPVLVSAMEYNGESAQALQALNTAIDQAAASGKPAPLDWYQQGVSIGYRAKNPSPELVSATMDINKKLVAAYPTKTSWHDALVIFIDKTKAPTDVQVDTFRLQHAAGALLGDGEYRQYAADVYLPFPNEAQTILQEGISKGIVNASNKDAQDLIGLTKGKVAADKASLAASDKSARTSPNAKPAVSTADAYVSYGDYAKAVDLYKVALTKAGADAGMINLHMGRALALSGDAAGAKQAFAAVTGPRKTLADFWTIHLDHPTQG